MTHAHRLAGLAALSISCTTTDPEPMAIPNDARLVTVTASDDYSAGGLAVVPDGGGSPVDVTSLHGDAVVDTVGPVVVAINRLGMDTIRRYDVLGGAPTWEVSTERGSNPHAVAAAAGRWLVTRYEETEAWVLDPNTGDLLGVVDLAGEADIDGIPEMSSAVAEGDLVLVGLQRLDRDNNWTADPQGRVAVIDPVELSVVRMLPVGPNPVLEAHPDGGAVAACEDGLWRVQADGRVSGPVRPDGLDDTIGALTVANDGSTYVITRPCLFCSEHTVRCLEAWDGPLVGQTEPISVFLSNIAVLDDTVWIAARRGWEDPSTAGGLVPLSRSDCGPLPPPDDWFRGTFAPYDLAVRDPA
ncbi:MAG: hypothetical protein AAGA48_11480 [Myxococcota bacterium]